MEKTSTQQKTKITADVLICYRTSLIQKPHTSPATNCEAPQNGSKQGFFGQLIHHLLPRVLWIPATNLGLLFREIRVPNKRS
ncbi:hypothetical protein L596_015308 [Steinernema carpocapsae]|uniref:Uncharacterized protein n=1 Tax=Steinernema carpocapsae TaxID=34508 RepID=A0A4U5NFK5_STECR|nr:hypothetical protein L596_015308 [Steinernema carpocapsae]